MVCDPTPTGADVRNRGIGRGRLFIGGILLFAAVIAWGIGFMMSPHGSAIGNDGDHVRNTVVVFLRNSAIGTLLLCALAGWLLFPARRPRWPARDYAILGLLGIMAASSIYNLIWLQTSVVN
jgi:drug/metabolite transporter (DMT)-like permease